MSSITFYEREILKQQQPTLQELNSLRTSHPKHNPVEEAYEILTKAYFSKETDLDGAYVAIEEAIGFLGEALAD